MDEAKEKEELTEKGRKTVGGDATKTAEERKGKVAPSLDTFFDKPGDNELFNRIITVVSRLRIARGPG